MTATVLADALGPRARRRVWIASVISGVAVALLVVAAIARLHARGQLAAPLWRPFTQWPVWRFLLGGLVATLRAALGSMVLAIVIGLLLALGRLAQNRPMRWLAGAWVEFFRGVPLLLLILFSALALPKYGLNVSLFWYLVIGLVLYNSAVLAEIFRAGIQSLDRGQMEAAVGLGLTYWQAMGSVLIPQAFRRMVPAVVSQLVTLLKDTSLGTVIAYEELLRRANILGVARKNLLQSLFIAALIYIAVNVTLSRISHRLEVRQRTRYSAGSISVAGVEDLAVVAAQGQAATTATT
jgi:glutamate transport system permease protein